MNDTDLPEVSSAVMFMIVEINGHWKIPVTYYFINSLNSTERASIVNDTLTFVHETRVLVTSITFDGLRSNFLMATQFGAKLNMKDNLQVYFAHPISKAKIFVILNPCHTLKLIRNLSGKAQVLVDGDGNTIQRSFVKKLVQPQKQHGLHAATKTHKKHLNWQNEKMKVFLAAQTLSNGVVKTLTYLRRLKIIRFKNSEATEKFCFIITKHSIY